MLCQNESGVSSGSEIFFNTISQTTQRLFYYVGSCGHYYCERGYKIRRKYADTLLLMCIEKGTMRLDYEGRHYEAAAGDIILMDCTFPQYYDTPDYVEFCWMHVAGVNAFELCDHLTRACGIVHRTPNNDKAALLIRHLLSEFKTNQPIIPSEHSRLLHSIFCYLMPDARSRETAAAAGADRPVQQAVKYIQAHLSEELSLRQVAAQVNFSPSHLIRLFQKEFGQSPHEYIILTRMDHAKYLLKTTSMPIKAIAGAVGYRTESGFTNAFTEKIGLSPRQFRDLPLG